MSDLAEASQKNAHTPGPWVCYADLPSTEPNWHIITAANKLRVLANVHIEPGNPADRANARLIAAAPDLLAVINQFPARADFARAEDFACAVDEWWTHDVGPVLTRATGAS